MRITGSGKATWLPASLGVLAALLLVTAAAAEEALFVSREVGKATDYTKGIEGPAVDAAGVLYVANFGKLGSIEKLKPGAAQAELFVQLPDGNVGNGIRFDRQGRMYVCGLCRTPDFRVRGRPDGAECLPRGPLPPA